MINKHETIYQELTPEEIREQYGLQIDEDLEKYVKHINFQSKGRRIKIIYKKRMAEEYMNMAEIRKLLGMPKFQYSEKEVIAALEEYNKNFSTNIILIRE